MAASEAAPFAKTGGLADVLGTLPQALVRQGAEAAVVLPRYGSIPLTSATRVYTGLRVWFHGSYHLVDVWRMDHGGVPYFLLDCPPLYDRAGIYGDAFGDFGDNHVRYATLSLGALGVARHLFRPDVIHAHDWHAALTPLYLKNFYPGDPTFAGVKTLFSIHNLYDARLSRSQLNDIGLDDRYWRPDLLEFHNSASMLKAGLVFADRLASVSPGYAREIQTEEQGGGYEGLLAARGVTGILNGVDYEEWNPETDRYIAANYSATDLAGKRQCKAALLAAFGFDVEARIDKPLVGVVSRLADQKGFQLIEQVYAEFAALDMTFILLGSGESRYEMLFMSLERNFRGHMRAYLGYSNAIAHQIEAGADIFLMPSRYEPCGLNQIYSLRYGTLPVVRATGGLDDTIDKETGFKFWGFTGREMVLALRHAIETYQEKDRWKEMMVAAMGRDFSWQRSAAQYLDLYRTL